MTRAERLAQIQAGVARGLTHQQIAAELGVSRSAVRNIISDPDGSKQRARRLRYQGVCETCGAATDGSNGRAKAPRFCLYCAPRAHAFWSRETIVECIREFADMYGRPPSATDWNPGHAVALGFPEKAARFHDDACWPPVSVVQYHFECWADAVEAAGFERPRVGGYERSDETRRKLSESHTYWTGDRIVEAIQAFARRYGRPPAVTDWNPVAARAKGVPGRVECFYADNCWPWSMTVVRRFGSWNAAIAAAGFQPRRRGQRVAA